MRNAITWPFPNFSGFTIEVSEFAYLTMLRSKLNKPCIRKPGAHVCACKISIPTFWKIRSLPALIRWQASTEFFANLLLLNHIHAISFDIQPVSKNCHPLWRYNVAISSYIRDVYPLTDGLNFIHQTLIVDLHACEPQPTLNIWSIWGLTIGFITTSKHQAM